MITTTTSSSATVTDIAWKPIGRGRKFDRMARGLARRLRIPYVRRVLWEQANPQIHTGNATPTYAAVWTSTNALADYSFACTCHKRDRYSRKGFPDDETLGAEIDELIREYRAEQRPKGEA